MFQCPPPSVDLYTHPTFHGWLILRPSAVLFPPLALPIWHRHTHKIHFLRNKYSFPGGHETRRQSWVMKPQKKEEVSEAEKTQRGGSDRMKLCAIRQSVCLAASQSSEQGSAGCESPPVGSLKALRQTGMLGWSLRLSSGWGRQTLTGLRFWQHELKQRQCNMWKVPCVRSWQRFSWTV